MVFSSAIFLFFFLPPVFLLSRLPLGKRWQNLLLAAASLVFYAFGNLQYVPLFLASVLLNYVTGLLLGGAGLLAALIFLLLRKKLPARMTAAFGRGAAMLVQAASCTSTPR